MDQSARLYLDDAYDMFDSKQAQGARDEIIKFGVTTMRLKLLDDSRCANRRFA